MDERFADIPRELVSHVVAACGPSGEKWLEDLPATIRHLEGLWAVKIAEPFPGVEYNFVAPARTQDGADVVVKIHPPWDVIEIFDEAAYLRIRDGNHCVRLLAVDEETRSIMIERLFPGRTLTQLFSNDKREAIGPAISVLQKIRMPASFAPAGAPTVDEYFKNFERFRETDFPHNYAEKAFDIYNDLSPQPGRTLYIHGDFHPANVVNSDREPYLIIDPKGIVGHIGYEIACFLNNYHWWYEDEPDVRPILADVVRQFAVAFEMPEIELRQWAYTQMVIGAWWNFADLPDLYDGSVVKADIWDV